MAPWNSLIFVGLCALINGALSVSQCRDSNLAITGGSFTLTQMYNHGSILRYICPEGYHPHPVTKRECYRGRWNPAPIRKVMCKQVTCPNPKVLQNGDVEPNKPVYYVNDTTTYSCHADYVFRGSSTRVCQANGKWSGVTPICSINSDYCPDPGTPPGASRKGQIFNINDKVMYTCDKKLKLIGSKERVCQDNGQWSGKEPECYADFTYDTPEEVAEAFTSTLRTSLTMAEVTAQSEKRIRLDRNPEFLIYIALDASHRIDKHFDDAKNTIIGLIEKISYFQVNPYYEIIIFTSNVTRIGSIAEQRRHGKGLEKVISDLEDYKYDEKAQMDGTNIAKAYRTILEGISFEKARETDFKEIHHIIIMFTYGFTNMGGNPRSIIEQIKQTVYDGDERTRREFLDLYVFGMGTDVPEDVNDWVIHKANEKHLFLLLDFKHLNFDLLTDDNTGELCGLYRDQDDGTNSAMRQRYPWLLKIFVTHSDGTVTTCSGSLITSRFILTAAHCFKVYDVPEKIKIEAPYGKDLRMPKVINHIIHPEYKSRENVKEGISELYEYDVALIQLRESIRISRDLRTICIPCTQETSVTLKLSSRNLTCKEHKELLMNNDNVKAFFMSANEQGDHFTRSNIQIKQHSQVKGCIKDVKSALNITEGTVHNITTNFLCTGGTTQSYFSCKGDSGGAIFVEQKDRTVQVGIVSWRLKDVCTAGVQSETTRGFHTNLFDPKVQAFLKQYLGNERSDTPLTFLEN